MPHPLVTQLHFARSSFAECLDGISAEEAQRRLGPMNCMSWIIGHLANQEHAYWVLIAQGEMVLPGLNNLVGSGKPASTPPLDEMWEAWRTATAAADRFLMDLTTERLTQHLTWKGEPWRESIGTMLLRNTYHYWFHIGEAHAIRQQLGHTALPQYVGDMAAAFYRPEEEA